MTLNTSGPISLGGSVTGESIALQLGQSSTAQIALNDNAVRTLAGVTLPSSEIVMPTDFYGKPLPATDYSTFIYTTSGYTTKWSPPYGSVTVNPDGSANMVGMLLGGDTGNDKVLAVLPVTISGGIGILKTTPYARYDSGYNYSLYNVYPSWSTNGMQYSAIRRIIQDADGNVYGVYTYNNSNVGYSSTRVRIAKFNSAGALLAVSESDTYYADYSFLGLDLALNRLVVMTTDATASTFYILYFTLDTLLLDSTNSVQISGLPSVPTSGVSSPPVYNINNWHNATLGTVYSIGASVQTSATSTSAYVFAKGANWAKKITFPILNAGYTITAIQATESDNLGNLYILGYSVQTQYLNQGNIVDYVYIIKLNSSGVVQWQKKIDYLCTAYGQYDFGAVPGLYIDANDNVYVSLVNGNLAYRQTLVLLRFNPVDGSIVWQREFTQNQSYSSSTPSGGIYYLRAHINRYMSDYFYITINSYPSNGAQATNFLRLKLDGSYAGSVTANAQLYPDAINAYPNTPYGQVYNSSSFPITISNAAATVEDYIDTTPTYSSATYGVYSTVSETCTNVISAVGAVANLAPTTAQKFISSYWFNIGYLTTPTVLKDLYPMLQSTALAIGQDKSIVIGGYVYYTPAFGGWNRVGLPVQFRLRSDGTKLGSSVGKVLPNSTYRSRYKKYSSSLVVGTFPFIVPDKNSYAAMDNQGTVYQVGLYDIGYSSSFTSNYITFYSNTISGYSANGVQISVTSIDQSYFSNPTVDEQNQVVYVFGSIDNGATRMLITFYMTSMYYKTNQIISGLPTSKTQMRLATPFNSTLGVVYSVYEVSPSDKSYIFAKGAGWSKYASMYVLSMCCDSSANTYGASFSFSDGFTKTTIFKLNSSGGSEWVKTLVAPSGYTGAGVDFHSYTCDNSGNTYHIMQYNLEHTVLTKFNSSGAVVWCKNINISVTTSGFSLPKANIRTINVSWSPNDSANVYVLIPGLTENNNSNVIYSQNTNVLKIATDGATSGASTFIVTNYCQGYTADIQYAVSCVDTTPPVVTDSTITIYDNTTYTPTYGSAYSLSYNVMQTTDPYGGNPYPILTNLANL